MMLGRHASRGGAIHPDACPPSQGYNVVTRMCALAVAAMLSLGLVSPPSATAFGRHPHRATPSVPAVVWTQQYGTAANDYVNAVTHDDGGDIYLTGRNDGGEPNAYVRRVSSNGTVVWTRTLPQGFYGYTVAIGPSGDVYVGGVDGNGTGMSFIRRYTPSGGVVWTWEFDMSVYLDYVTAIAVGPGDDVYVTGITDPDSGLAYASRFHPDGAVAWSDEWQGTSGGVAVPTGIGVDDAGNAYVTGSVQASLPPPYDTEGAFLRKYSLGGSLVWHREFGKSPYDAAYGIYVDPSGHAHVAGQTSDALGTTDPGDSDGYLRRYAPDGSIDWTRYVGSPGGDVATAVAGDGLGHIYVAGNTSGDVGGPNQGSQDVFVRGWSIDGQVLWTDQFGSSASDSGVGVAANASGAVYIAGITNGTLPGQTSKGGLDTFVRKYGPASAPSSATCTPGAAGATVSIASGANVACIFTAGTGATFTSWSASGITPSSSSNASQSFTAGPTGPGAVTAAYSDGTGNHAINFNYNIDDGVVVSGAGWFGGKGVNVCYPATATPTSCGGESAVGTSGWPDPWQCVELAQRFFKSRGWYAGAFGGVSYAYQIKAWAKADRNMAWHDNNTSYVPTPGDLIVTNYDTNQPPPTPGDSHNAGHVAVVDFVDTIDAATRLVHVVEQNGSPNGRATYDAKRNSGGTWTITRDSPHDRLSRVVLGTVHVVVRKPDGRIRLGSSGAFAGNNVYNTTGSGQSKAGSAKKGKTIVFQMSVQNDSSAADSFTLKATGSATSKFTIKYFKGTTDITARVLAGTYSTGSLTAGATQTITADVTVKSRAAVGDSISRLVTITSVGNSAKKDAVKLTGKRA